VNRSILNDLLKQLLKDLNPAYTGNPGTHEYETVMKPILQRFGSDPLMPSPAEFVRSSLQAAFPDMETSVLSTNADIVGIPFESLLEVVRRELRVTQLTSSLAYASQLTTDEVEALLTSTRVERTKGKNAIVNVRMYFSTPRFVGIPLTSIAFTSDGKEFGVQDYFSFQPDEMVDNREGEYYYVEALFVSSGPGTRYNIPPSAIKSVSNVAGLVYATNKYAGEYGADEETIPDYIERIKSEVSSRSPSTKRGIAKMVEDTMGAYEVHSVGKGDVYMTRDIARWTLDTDEVKVTLFNGTDGTLVSDAVPSLFGVLPSIWTNSIVDLDPAIPAVGEDDTAPTHIVLGGTEYEIVEGTFDDGLPVTDVTFLNYEAINGGPNKVNANFGNAVGGGARVPHSTNAVMAPAGVVGGELWLWLATSPFVVIPPALDYAFPGPGELFSVVDSVTDGVKASFQICDLPVVYRKSYNQTYAIEITGGGGGVVAQVRFGTVDEFLAFTAVGWQNNPELPATTMFLAVEFIVPVGAGYAPPPPEDPDPGDSVKLLLELTFVDPDMTGTVNEDFAGYLTAAQFDVVFSVARSPVVLSGTADLWTLYSIGDYFDAPYNPGDGVVLRQLGPELLLWTAANQTWSVRRPVIGADIKGSLLLPSGDVMDTEGNIPLGGCTDVYLYAPPSSGRTITLQDFPDLDVVLEGANASWSGGIGTTNVVVIPGSYGVIRRGDVVTIDHGVDGGSYRVITVVISTDDVVLDHEFSFDVIDVPFTVHRLMRCSLSESTKIVHSGVDAKTGLIAKVSFTGALPTTVEEGQTLRLLTGMSAGDYEVGTVYATSVDLDKPTVASENNISYNFLANYPHPDLPLLNVEEIRVLTPYVDPAAPGGDPTGTNLTYRLPVRVEALSNSISNGPGVRIPQEYGFSGAVTVAFGLKGYVCTLTWLDNDFREFNVQTGDVLYLDGTYIRGNFFITDLDHDGTDGTVTFIYYGPNRNFVPAADATPVEFAVFARNIANLRLYFEDPMYAHVGRVLSDVTGITATVPPSIVDETIPYTRTGLTTFTYGGSVYVLNALDEQVFEMPMSSGVTCGQYDLTHRTIAFSSPATDPTLLADSDLVAKDVVRILTIPIETQAVLTEFVNAMGTTLSVEVNDSPRTVVFKGSANPILLDDDTGYGGVKQQLEAALPVEVEVIEDPPATFQLVVRSRDRLRIIGGGALVYLVGLDDVPYNVPDYAGEYEVLYNVEGVLNTLPEVDADYDDVPPTSPEVIIDIHRVGHRVVEPSEMGFAYGFYYMDFEAMSLGGGDDHAVLQGTSFEIGGEYVLPGFDLLTDNGLVYSVDELAELNVTPYAADVNGDLKGITDAQFEVVYGTVPTVTLLQRFLTTENYRATSDDTKAKCKPIMRIGVGPILATTTLNKADLVKIMNNRISETIALRSYITLGDVLSWLAPYGVTGTTDTRLIVHYTDMDRRRRLLLATTVTVNKIWHIEADADLLVSATSQ